MKPRADGHSVSRPGPLTVDYARAFSGSGAVTTRYQAGRMRKRKGPLRAAAPPACVIAAGKFRVRAGSFPVQARGPGAHNPGCPSSGGRVVLASTRSALPCLDPGALGGRPRADVSNVQEAVAKGSRCLQRSRLLAHPSSSASFASSARL